MRLIGATASAEYTAGDWGDDESLRDACATWKSLLDDALIGTLFDCVQKLSSTSLFHVELLFALVNCGLV